MREALVAFLPDVFGPVAEHHEKHRQHRHDIDELPHVLVQTEWSVPTASCLSVCPSVRLQPISDRVYVEGTLTHNQLFRSGRKGPESDWFSLFFSTVQATIWLANVLGGFHFVSSGGSDGLLAAKFGVILSLE